MVPAHSAAVAAWTSPRRNLQTGVIVKICDELLKALYEGGEDVRRRAWPAGDYISADGAIWYYSSARDDFLFDYRLGFHDLGANDWEVVS